MQKLERSKRNVSRAVGKLIRDGYITGNSINGYISKWRTYRRNERAA